MFNNFWISKYYTLVSILIIIIKLVSSVNNYYRPFMAGHDIDGKNLFICRINKFGETIPGKYSENIGKCSIGNNKKELQFNKFELLIEDDQTKYEWIELKKPVFHLPNNVLYGGRKFDSNSDEFFNVFMSSSSNQKHRKRRRRFRRDLFDSHQQWSRNWRGFIHTNDSHHQYLKRINRHNYQNNKNDFIEIYSSNSIKNCSLNQHQHSNKNLCMKNINDIDNNNKISDNIKEEKLNYFIAKCSLRTGDKFSEQIGKIWWKNSIAEWIASISFAGHEIYCLDFSILTLKQ